MVAGKYPLSQAARIMQTKALFLVSGLIYALGIASARAVADEAADDATMEEWFEQDSSAQVPQAGENEIVFLPSPPDAKTPHSNNRITISETSVSNGWVQLEQCYQGLDAVPELDVVYRYKNMRGLRVISAEHIGKVLVTGQRLQLFDIQRDASLCIQAQAKILYHEHDKHLVLRNGPFHRQFLDGYFPLHVTLNVNFPNRLLQYAGSSPAAQAGFSVKLNADEGSLQVDSWFAGTLYTEIRFVFVPSD